MAILLLRCASICLITAGSSILAITLTAPPHSSQVVISISPRIAYFRLRAPTFGGEYSLEASPHGAYFWCAFMPSGAGQRGMLLHRRSLIAVYLAFGALTSFRRRHQGSVLAVWLMRHSDEHAMEACQIGSRPGHQGSKSSHEIQWLEDNVGSTISIRCLQLIANVAVWR